SLTVPSIRQRRTIRISSRGIPETRISVPTTCRSSRSCVASFRTSIAPSRYWWRAATCPTDAVDLSTSRRLDGVRQVRRAVLLWLVALVAACGDQLAARQAYLARFVGQPESAVVQQMGVPTRSFETGGIRYLAYNQRRIELIPAFPTYGAFYPAWYGG